ncbi:MAG: hypothetical protein KIS62_12335 [Ramlibacter sp.]|nr:hypothetical protein [Ramlibacter sp.]MCW5650526.1 hypothetical protein [Ramlibacter sp.]
MSTADITTMDTISRRADVYAAARALLQERVTALNEGLAALHTLVADNPGLFVKPKTQVFAGIKVGFAKGKGAITYDKPEVLIARIKRLLPEQADILIDTKEKPNKAALALLSAADLKKLGCTVADTGDQAVVRPVDGAVDKLVAALLKSASADEREEAGGDES